MSNRTLYATCLFVICTHILAAESETTDKETDSSTQENGGVSNATASNADSYENIEEMTVLGTPDEYTTPITIDRIYADRRNGEHYYRTRQYEKAYPFLLISARRGFKYAQARLGFIYQQGLGGIPRNGEAAIGWLGVAASPRTFADIRNHFKGVLARIPDEYMPLVNSIVEEYIEKYGSKATGVHCRPQLRAGSHITNLACDLEEEFYLNTAQSYMLNPAFDPLTTTGTGQVPFSPPGG